MHWLQSLDTALFHLINGRLGNPVFDWLMPVLSGGGNVLRGFSLLLLAGAITALIWGGARARICALLLFIAVAAGDPLVVGTIKNLVGRPRPCVALPDVVERLGCSGSGSMPSAHAANWFACAMVMLVFYRRSAWFMFPLAAAVAFSRVYCGVHYPSDVLAGAILGAGYATALMVLAQYGWNFVGRKFFPLWHTRMPSLLAPESGTPGGQPADATTTSPQPEREWLLGVAAAPRRPSSIPPQPEREWLRLGFLLIVVSLVARWLYIASGLIDLSQDEAYQWLWSKHLALSYVSKPPGIAYIQWAGTHIWGDTDLGVRFFSPLFGAILGWLILNFLAREIGARRAFMFLLIALATPLLVVGSILMTIDPPLVLCWMWAVIAGWRAVQPDGKTRDWLAVGLATGLAFLCKYSALYIPVCLGIYFALQPAARLHLRRRGPWLALGLLGLSTVPVVVWNWQHSWATLHHVEGNAGLDSQWHPTLQYFLEFLGSQFGLLNPVFFIGAMWACLAFWKKRKERPLYLFLFCMGGPVFFGHWLYALHSRILPNWIAPAVPPLLCLMVLFWSERRTNLKPWLALGLTIGILMSAVMYDSDLIGKVIARLPGDKDPSHRVRGWRETALAVEAGRTKFDTNAFIIADHYGTTGLFTFYSPAARAAASSDTPLVYCIDSDEPVNQLFFWDDYNYRAHRHGQNALFVVRLDPYPLEHGWLWKWLRHEPVHEGEVPPPRAVPRRIADEFESVTNLGIREIKLNDGRVFQRVELFGCYHLK